MSYQEPNNGVFLQSEDQEVDENWVQGWSAAAIGYERARPDPDRLWFPTENQVHETSCYDMIFEAPRSTLLLQQEAYPCMQKNDGLLHKGEPSCAKTMHVSYDPPALEMQTREINKDVPEEEFKTSDKRKLATSSLTRSRKVYQRLRRQKFREKMMILQELIPNCNKRDSLLILDDAIKHMEYLQCQLNMVVGMKYDIETGMSGRFSPFDFPTMSQFGLCNPYLMPATTTAAATNFQNQEINFPELLNLTPSSSHTHSSGFQASTSEEARDGLSSKNELRQLVHDHEKFCPWRGESSTRVLPSQIIPSKDTKNHDISNSGFGAGSFF